VLPVPFLRSTGIGGMLIPLVSVAVVLTLLPALLAGVGPRWDWPRIRNESNASRGWTRWAQGVARRPWLGALAAVVILGIAIAPVLRINVGQTSAEAEASTGVAHDLYQQLLTGGIPGGVLTPMEVLATQASAAGVVKDLNRVAGVETAVLPSGSTGTRQAMSDIIVIPSTETVNSSASMARDRGNRPSRAPSTATCRS
jgi:RND superfamily putative drug exporter